MNRSELDRLDKLIVELKNKLWAYKIWKSDSEENKRNLLLLNNLKWKRAKLLRELGIFKPI